MFTLSSSQVFDATSMKLMADLADYGERYVLAKGGPGGRVEYGTAGKARSLKGERKKVLLELKSLADVGLIGYTRTLVCLLLSKRV